MARWHATRTFVLPRRWTLGLSTTLAHDGSWQVTQACGTVHQYLLSVQLVRVRRSRVPMLSVVVGPLCVHALLTNHEDREVGGR